MRNMIEQNRRVVLGYERKTLEEAKTAVVLGMPLDLDTLVEALANAVAFGLSAHDRLRQTRRSLRRARWETARAKLAFFVLVSFDGPDKVSRLVEDMPDGGEAVALFTSRKKAEAYRGSDPDQDAASDRAIPFEGDVLREFLRDCMTSGTSHVACDPVQGRRSRYELILHFLAEAEGK